MINDLHFFLACIGISVVLLVIAFLLNLFVVIPKLWQNLHIPNGLGKIRNVIFSRVTLGEILIAIVIFCLTSRFFIHDTKVLRYVIGVAIVGFSIDVLSKIVLDVIMVYQQFTKEHIEKAIRIQQELNRKKVIENKK